MIHLPQLLTAAAPRLLRLVSSTAIQSEPLRDGDTRLQADRRDDAAFSGHRPGVRAVD